MATLEEIIIEIKKLALDQGALMMKPNTLIVNPIFGKWLIHSKVVDERRFKRLHKPKARR